MTPRAKRKRGREKAPDLSRERTEQAVTVLWLDGFSFREIDGLLALHGSDHFFEEIIRRNVVKA
jgi:hypothetical protein